MELDKEGHPASRYAQDGAAVDVRRVEELAPTIDRLLRDDSEQSGQRSAVIEAYFHRNDGGATRRVADYLCGVLDTLGDDS